MSPLPHTHPDRDDTLVARLAADDIAPGSRDDTLARARIADCPACAELHADLQAIVAATADLPAPRRTRDFQLTDADAARLRRTGWRDVLARLGSPSFAFTRPLAAGLATLGIAGLLLATVPFTFLAAGSASAPEALPGTNGTTSQAGGGAPATASPGFTAAPAGPDLVASGAPNPPPAGSSPAPVANGTPLAAPSPGTGVSGGTTTDSTKDGGPLYLSASPSARDAAGTPPEVGHGASAGGGGPSALVVLSLAMLAAGLGLGGLRFVARRLG